MAFGALLDSRDLPRSKRTQPIDNGTKYKLDVTYSELNESKMNKTHWHFHPKIQYSLYLATQIVYSSRLVKNKTLSDNLHYAACKQSHSRVDPNARSLDSERLERAPIDRAGVYERARSYSEWVNERISDSSECSNVSELVFERAHNEFFVVFQLVVLTLCLKSRTH